MEAYWALVTDDVKLDENLFLNELGAEHDGALGKDLISPRGGGGLCSPFPYVMGDGDFFSTIQSPAPSNADLAIGATLDEGPRTSTEAAADAWWLSGAASLPYSKSSSNMMQPSSIVKYVVKQEFVSSPLLDFNACVEALVEPLPLPADTTASKSLSIVSDEPSQPPTRVSARVKARASENSASSGGCLKRARGLSVTPPTTIPPVWGEMSFDTLVCPPPQNTSHRRKRSTSVISEVAPKIARTAQRAGAPAGCRDQKQHKRSTSDEMDLDESDDDGSGDDSRCGGGGSKKQGGNMHVKKLKKQVSDVLGKLHEIEAIHGRVPTNASSTNGRLASLSAFFEQLAGGVCESQPWVSILDENVMMALPSMPFRSGSGGALSLGGSQHVKGIDAVCAEAAALGALSHKIGTVVSSVRKSRGLQGSGSGTSVRLVFSVAPGSMLMAGDDVMSHWVLQVEGLTSAGFESNCAIDGMLRGKFNAIGSEGSHKLKSVELVFDVLSFLNKLQRQGLLSLDKDSSSAKAASSLPAPPTLSRACSNEPMMIMPMRPGCNLGCQEAKLLAVAQRSDMVL